MKNARQEQLRYTPIQGKFYGKSQKARKVLMKRGGGSCSKPQVRSLAEGYKNVANSPQTCLENKVKKEDTNNEVSGETLISDFSPFLEQQQQQNPTLI